MENRTQARPELLSVINKTEILKLLRQKSLSRAEIARNLGISFPTVTANVKALMAAGLISERGDGTNELGRKSRLLRYNARRGYVLGSDIGRKSIHLILADLAGRKQDEFSIPLEKGGVTESVLAELDQKLNQMLRKAYIQPDHIFSVCIGVPYRVDSSFRADYLNIQGGGESLRTLDRYFGQKFQGAIYVENNINLGALGEKTYGIGRGYRNIFYLDFGVGIGSTLLLNDQLFRGAGSAAGEVAYCIPDTAAMRSDYRDTGLLEEQISAAAQRVGLIPDRDGHIREMKPAFDRAAAGDADAIAFLDLMARYISVILINSVALINPDAVIFAGGVGCRLLECYHDEFVRVLAAHVPQVPQLLRSSLEKRASSLGGVSVALDHLNQDYAALERALQRSTPPIGTVFD